MKSKSNRWYASADFWSSLGFCVMMVVLMWLYCAATPPQMSAECDWARAELEGK